MNYEVLFICVICQDQFEIDVDLYDIKIFVFLVFGKCLRNVFYQIYFVEEVGSYLLGCLLCFFIMLVLIKIDEGGWWELDFLNFFVYCCLVFGCFIMCYLMCLW